MHATTSSLKDWDGSHGPTSEAVAKGIAGIWAAVPKIKIEILDVYTQATSPTCVANIKVHVDETTTLKVCDIFVFDNDGKVVSIDAFKTD